jgi:hypothetical protein
MNSWNRILLEKIVVPKPLKKFHTFYGTLISLPCARRFITDSCFELHKHSHKSPIIFLYGTATCAVKWLLMMGKESPKHVECPELKPRHYDITLVTYIRTIYCLSCLYGFDILFPSSPFLPAESYIVSHHFLGLRAWSWHLTFVSTLSRIRGVCMSCCLLKLSNNIAAITDRLPWAKGSMFLLSTLKQISKLWHKLCSDHMFLITLHSLFTN